MESVNSNVMHKTGPRFNLSVEQDVGLRADCDSARHSCSVGRSSVGVVNTECKCKNPAAIPM